MSVDFVDLFAQAWRLEISGQVTASIAAYRDIAALANEDHEVDQHAKAILGAGRTTIMAITEASGSYYRDALSLLAEALQEVSALNDPVAVGVTYREMARAADADGDYANAAVFFQKSLATLSDSESDPERSATYAELGAHLGSLGQFDGAIQMLQQALDDFKQQPLAGYYQARARTELGIVQLRSGKLDEAQAALEDAIGWFEADHGRDHYRYDLCRLYGVGAILIQKQAELSEKRTWQKKHDQLLRSLEVIAASALQSRLRQLTH